MVEGSGPVTRFSATELAFGWANRTDSPGAMLKPSQLSTAFWLDWVTVMAPPPAETLAEPAATEPPVGSAWATDASASELVAARSARRARPAWPVLRDEGEEVRVRRMRVMGSIFMCAGMRAGASPGLRTAW